MQLVCRGRILKRNWDKSLKSFAIHSHLYKRILLPFPLSKSGLKLVCNVNIVYGNLKSENSQDYAQKPQWNCTFINTASGPVQSTLIQATARTSKYSHSPPINYKFLVWRTISLFFLRLWSNLILVHFLLSSVIKCTLKSFKL